MRQREIYKDAGGEEEEAEVGWIWKVMGGGIKATDQEWSSPPGENDTRINQSVSRRRRAGEQEEVPLLVGPRSGHGAAGADCGH
jgi:hypothetical protein